MDIAHFLDKFGTAIIAVFGTIAGVVITQIFNWVFKKSEWSNQVRLRKLERSLQFEKQNLIDPIIEFMEAELSLIQIIYGKGFDKEPSPIEGSSSDHIKNLLAISARIKVYGDQELINKFEEFTSKRLIIGNKILDEKNRDLPHAYDDLKQAEILASEILKAFKSRLAEVET
jgi:hypothetical protein